jgi:hypothetical protein
VGQIICRINQGTNVSLVVQEQCFLLIKSWQMPCEDLVIAMRSPCRCGSGFNGKNISQPWLNTLQKCGSSIVESS